MATTYRVTQPWNHAQLVASMDASSKAGVPLEVVRGVTAFKYGPGATGADFAYVAGQLKGWYSHFYQQTGNALIAWQKAAGQEMGPTAKGIDVATATSGISTALNGIALAPALTGIGELLTPGLGAIGGAIDTAGADLAGAVDSTGVPAARTAAGDPASPSADPAGGKASDVAGKAAGTAAKVAAVGGLAGLLDLSGWGELLVRALEALAGAALILLGLQALTGQGSGNPVEAVRSSVRMVR